MHTQFAQAADLKIDAENCLSMPRDFAWNPLKFNILSLDFVDVSYVQRSIEQRVRFHLGLVLCKSYCFYKKWSLFGPKLDTLVGASFGAYGPKGHH